MTEGKCPVCGGPADFIEGDVHLADLPVPDKMGGRCVYSKWADGDAGICIAEEKPKRRPYGLKVKWDVG